MVFSINWPIFIVWLSLLLELLSKMCIGIVCFSLSDIINFKINLIFLIKPFLYMNKKSNQKLKWSFIKRQTSGTSSDNEWYNEWQQVIQRVTTSGTTNANEWQRVTRNDNEWPDRRVVQRVTLTDNEWNNEWQRMTTSGTTSHSEWQRVIQRVTANDNEWYNEWQQVVQQMTTNDNEWQRVVQRMTTSDNEWQRVTMSDQFDFFFFFFFQISEEPTTKHSKENSLNFEEDLWRRPIELRAEASP